LDRIFVVCSLLLEGESLLGRPAHTDSVSHDGTFHHQIIGSKVWSISRPGFGEFEVVCEPNDLFVIDTKNWRHSTRIPTQASGVSISVARDMYLPGSQVSDGSDLTNVDGPYAIEEIEGAGQVTLMHQDSHFCRGRVVVSCE
jgi:hypothetical protein